MNDLDSYAGERLADIREKNDGLLMIHENALTWDTTFLLWVIDCLQRQIDKRDEKIVRAAFIPPCE